MRRPIRARRAAAAAALCLVLAATGCAKKGMPTGGPPDLEPPRIVSVSPDSGAANVPLDTKLVVEFSEGMEPRGTGAAVELAPPVEIRSRHWKGRVLTLELRDSLKLGRTYTLFVGGGARDRHGNALSQPRTVVFTTAETFPPGVLDGKLEAVGFRAPGTLLWCYRDGRAPDSTARDFDALGVADGQGRFRISGLAAPAKWRIWAFADLNYNRSFEPASDLLASADTTLELTLAAPEARNLLVRMVNPRAPGRFAGSITDTLNDSLGVLRLQVVADSDTTRKLQYEVIASGFDFRWDPGGYRVRAYRDLDRNKSWKRESEPASEEMRIVLTPGGELVGTVFLLTRPEPAGTAPSGSGP